MTLDDEHARLLEQEPNSQGQTPGSLCAKLVEDPRDPRDNPHYYETDAWFLHLGMSDENIRNIKRSIRSELECPHDAEVCQVDPQSPETAEVDGP